MNRVVFRCFIPIRHTDSEIPSLNFSKKIITFRCTEERFKVWFSVGKVKWKASKAKIKQSID